MDNTMLFTLALQLDSPWKVTKINFMPDKDNSNEMELHIEIDFTRGARFTFYNDDGSVAHDSNNNVIETVAHDTVKRIWRHLNFFQYKTYVHARIPKIVDNEGHCLTVQIPWARKNSGFTLLFSSMS